MNLNDTFKIAGRTYKVVGFEGKGVLAVQYIKSRDSYSNRPHWIENKRIEKYNRGA